MGVKIKAMNYFQVKLASQNGRSNLNFLNGSRIGLRRKILFFNFALGYNKLFR